MNNAEKKEFWRRVRLNKNDCWEWTSTARSGYGVFHINNKHLATHRESYKMLIGKIPKGLELDHLCRNTICLNPFHLEPVTHRMNVLRGNNPCGIHARKTHCKYGHELSMGNIVKWLYEKYGFRECRVCKNRLGRESYYRQKGRLKK